jgi:RNA polymerase sigma-70 factor (ECF subfamily)
MNDFEQYRPLLFSIAYRMLGSAMEAEDIVQDTYLQFHKTPPETIESPKAFLITITTRLCINQLNSARMQRETYIGTWLPEPLLTADQPAAHVTQYDSISMAFMVLLENLSPAERAVFILREVFDYDYAEIGHILDKSETACRQLFSRAKKHIADHRPRFKPDPEEHRQILAQFAKAISVGDIDGLTAMLAEDVTLWPDGGGKARGAALYPLHGREKVALFVMASVRLLPENAQTEFVDVNGETALVIRDPSGTVTTVISIDIRQNQISGIRAIANPDKLRHL